MAVRARRTPRGNGAYYGRAGGCIITGNEDGIKHCSMNILYSLQHIDNVIPPQADAGVSITPAGRPSLASEHWRGDERLVRSVRFAHGAVVDISGSSLLLDAVDLTKAFGTARAVDHVSFQLRAGETLALIGPSGCGKTTTLKMVNRLIEPDEGLVRLGGEEAHAIPAHEWRRRIGYVIQSGGLLPHRSVAENIGLTPRLLGWEPKRIADKVSALLDMVGLASGDYADRAPSDLSGGQRQRVGLARALAGEPELLLMDEPFAALDPVTKDQLIDDIAALREKLGFASVIVTHDFSEALRLADRIAVMEAGRIVQIGAPRDLVAAPATESVRALLAAPRKTARAIVDAFADAPT